MTFDATKAIAIARGEIGVIEATRRNDHPRIVMYLNKLAAPPRLDDTRKVDHGLSWCGAFALWVLWRGGLALRGNFWAQRAVAQLQHDAAEAGAILAADESLEPCDLVIWRHHESAGATGHVAMITELGPDGAIRTIGGNERIDAEREGVRERWLTRPQRASIVAIVRPSRMLAEAS